MWANRPVLVEVGKELIYGTLTGNDELAKGDQE